MEVNVLENRSTIQYTVTQTAASSSYSDNFIII